VRCPLTGELSCPAPKIACRLSGGPIKEIGAKQKTLQVRLKHNRKVRQLDRTKSA